MHQNQQNRQIQLRNCGFAVLLARTNLKLLFLNQIRRQVSSIYYLTFISHLFSACQKLDDTKHITRMATDTLTPFRKPAHKMSLNKQDM